MKKNIGIAGAMLICVLAWANIAWQPTTGSVSFVIKNAGMPVEGKFSGIAASIIFDENDLSTAKVYASIKSETVNTGIEKRDKHLKKSDYFHTEKFPKIEMRLKTVSKTSIGYKGLFDVTIRGVSKTLPMDFTFDNKGATGVFQGKIELDRLDFGVGSKSLILGDKVEVTIKLNVEK